MDGNIKGALTYMRKKRKNVPLIHKGELLSKHQTLKILKWADKQGYELVSQIKDEEVDRVLNINVNHEWNGQLKI